MTRAELTRRQALACYAWLLGTSPILRGQQLMEEPPGRFAPPQELVNAFEIEAAAKRRLGGAMFTEIAGSDRRAFDRITFRPRMMVDTSGLDLTVELFGQSMYAPILVGPASQQGRFHSDGELATVRGASVAKTTMVVADRSSRPIREISVQPNAELWYQVGPGPDIESIRGRAQEAVSCGCKAVCLTLGNPEQQPAGIDWRVIARLRDGIAAPLLLKGIMSPGEAQAAVERGVQGIVVSNYRGRFDPGLASPIEVLPGIAEAVAGKIPVLIDGSFRRGSDILKALALGARAVMVARPALWGLAAYGAEGVQRVLELMQGELARGMAMLGRANVKLIDRSDVKLHRW